MTGTGISISVYTYKDGAPKATLFDKSKNWAIDGDMEMYLEYHAKKIFTIPDIQYIKDITLNLTLKLALDQYYTQPQSYQGESLRYAKLIIPNNANRKTTYYYFIDSYEWRGEKTVSLTMSMDTLNTFKFWTNESSYTDRTELIREHKSRFGQIITDEGNGKYTIFRKVDEISEGITPVLYKTNEEIVKDINNDLNWYLIYFTYQLQNQGDNFPLRIALVPDQEIMTNITGVKYPVLTPDNWPTGPHGLTDIWVSTVRKEYTTASGEKKYTTPWPNYDGYRSISISYTLNDGTTGNYEAPYKTAEKGFKIGIDRSKNLMQIWSWTLSSEDYKYSEVPNELSIKNVASIAFIEFGENPVYFFHKGLTNDKPGIPADGIYNPIYPESFKYKLKSIDDIDRTDLHLNKIIKCPYCPLQVTVSKRTDGTWDISLPEGVKLFAGGEYPGEYSNFDNTIGFENPKNIPQFQNNITTNSYPTDQMRTLIDTKITTRDDTNESKLLHSDFYQKKLVYDSFNYIYNFENIIDADNDPLRIKMTTSNAMNSRFLLQIQNVMLKKSTQDYDNIMVISRNNEYPIYTSDYLNYLKTGYNYDVKNKNLQNFLSIVGMGTSVGNSIINTAIASGLRTTKAGTPPKQYYDKGDGWTGINLNFESELRNYNRNVALNRNLPFAGLSLSILSTLVSGIGQIVSNEWQFQQKQIQAVNQGATISASDDISLCDEYTEGKAKMCTYSSSDDAKKLIADLFYYCGYNCNNLRGKPDMHNRQTFNYIQCNPEFTGDVLQKENIQSPLLDDIKAKLATGVTLFHPLDDEAPGGLYDFTQEKENWETFLVEQ